MDLALGLGDYYDIGALFSDERASADFYYRLLNAGFRIAATGGTDNFSDVWLDPPPGSSRTFARLSGPSDDGELVRGDQARADVFLVGADRVAVRGRGPGPGDEIALAAGAPPSLRVVADVVSIAPVDSLEVLVNGGWRRPSRRPTRGVSTFDGRVEVPPAAGWRCAPAARSRPTSATTTRSRRRRRCTSCAAVVAS